MNAFRSMVHAMFRVGLLRHTALISNRRAVVTVCSSSAGGNWSLFPADIGERGPMYTSLENDCGTRSDSSLPMSKLLNLSSKSSSGIVRLAGVGGSGSVCCVLLDRSRYLRTIGERILLAPSLGFCISFI